MVCSRGDPCTACSTAGLDCIRSGQDRTTTISENHVRNLVSEIEAFEATLWQSVPAPEQNAPVREGSPSKRRSLVLVFATISICSVVLVTLAVPLQFRSPPPLPGTTASFFYGRRALPWLSTISVASFIVAWLTAHSTMRILRPHLKASYQRLEWTCSCGKSMWGDYSKGENSPSPLTQTLPNCVSFAAGEDIGPQQSAPNPSNRQSRSACSIPPNVSLSSTIHTSPSLSSTSDHRPELAAGGDMPAYFELCVNRGKDKIQLCEILLTDVKGRKVIDKDMPLFAEIRKRYDSHRKRSLRGLLYRPHDIHFVLFGVLRAGVQTGIYDKPLAIPPPVEVTAKRYHYHECPLDPLPPMDRRTFFHYFWEHNNHPSQSENAAFQSLFFNRLPKKLGDSIFHQKGPKLQVGWGLHIIEGPNKTMLAW